MKKTASELQSIAFSGGSLIVDATDSFNPCDSCSLIPKFSNPQIFDMTEDYALIDKLQLISK